MSESDVEQWVQQVRQAWDQEAQRSGDEGDWRKLSSGILLNIAAAVPRGEAHRTAEERGWCGDRLWPTPVQNEQQPICKLPVGHPGWHRDGDCNWGFSTPESPRDMVWPCGYTKAECARSGHVHIPPSTPPARDSGRDEAREAAVLALAQRMANDNGLSTTGWDRAGIEWQDGWLNYARGLLALPAVAVLLWDGETKDWSA